MKQAANLTVHFAGYLVTDFLVTSGAAPRSQIQTAQPEIGRSAIMSAGRSRRLKAKPGMLEKRKYPLLSFCGIQCVGSLNDFRAALRRVLSATTAICGAGPYFANGGTFSGSKKGGGPVYNVSSNMEGDWGNTKTLHSGDPRDLIASVNVSLC